ncbi:MAG: hypothetical protein NTW10_01290 [Bacteroidetes bacterium]|nr:hypothetical protein [Bacteroidota bacterium]
MKTKDNKEKPDYLKHSKKELHEIFMYQFSYSDELISECYKLRIRVENSESEMIGLLKYLNDYQDIIIRGNINQLDIDNLCRLQKELIKEIRTRKIINKPKDSNPNHEPVLEYYRTGSFRNN